MKRTAAGTEIVRGQGRTEKLMFPKRTDEGGFINPAWERFNRVMGTLTIILILGGLAAMVFTLISGVHL